MKYWKLIALFVVGAITVIAASQLRPIFYPEPNVSAALASPQSETCLAPTETTRPAWECYDIPVSIGAAQAVSIQHESGEEHRATTFEKDGQIQFRFTPSQTGTWTFSTGDSIVINAERPDYAKGFVTPNGNKWTRSATGEAFVPQFVMYDKPDLDAGLDEFVDEHGFTGFHITNLRDFLKNPGYFEAVALKTYRHGGATHFWVWGDESRDQTPETYGVDADELYREIAARLSPIPGWSVGYGFDLFEWASAEEIEDFRNQLMTHSSYRHMVGGRGYKNEYKEISSNLDYTSWEWHQPSYADYQDHLEKGNGKPVFSEDRFRIRTPTRYPEKDYNPELTLKGLWHSAIAGGIANIWGYKPEGKEFSEPYPNKAAIATYSQFINKTFTVNMTPDNTIANAGNCLRDTNKSAICYVESISDIELNLQSLDAPLQAIAVDTQKDYSEIEIEVPTENNSIQLPYESDWAIYINN